MNRNLNVSERTTKKRDRHGNETVETVKYDTRNADNQRSGVWSQMTNWAGDYDVPRPMPQVPMPQSMISHDLNDPTNRDSVPAVLTPGEFVLNKEASQMYAPQIEAMNNHGLQQRHQENVAMMNGGHVPTAPLAGLNAGGRAEAAHIANQRKLVDWQNKGDYSSTPWFRPSPGPDIAPQYKPNNPVIKPHSRAGASYYNTGGEVPNALGVPEIQMYNDGDLVIPGFFLGGLVDAAKELFGGTPTQVQDPYAGYADYTQQQFVDEAQNPSAGVAPAGAEYPGLPAGYTTPPGQPGIPDVPRGSLAGQQEALNRPNVGSTENKIAQVNNQLGFQTNTGGLLGTGADPLPSIDLTPPPPMSDQSLIQNSSQAMEQTEDNLSAISQGIDPNNPWANVPRGSVNNQDYAANQYRGVGVPPMGSQIAIPEPVGTGQFNAVPATQEVSQQQPQASNVYDAIAQHEGFREEAYDDGTGVWTIGFGRTYNSDGTKVQPGQKSTRDAEQAFLVGRVDEDKKYVQDYAAKHGYNWDDNQINALTSFTYNLGKGGLDKLTNNGKRSNDEIASKLPEYNKAGGEVMTGLTNRRNDEAALFSGSISQASEVPPIGASADGVPPVEGIPEVSSNYGAMTTQQIRDHINSGNLTSKEDQKAAQAALAASEEADLQNMRDAAAAKVYNGGDLTIREETDILVAEDAIEQRKANQIAAKAAKTEREAAELAAIQAKKESRDARLAELGVATPEQVAASQIPTDAEGVVAAEAEIANQTGVNVTDEQVAQTKLQATDALTASGNKAMADSLASTGVSSVGGKGTDPAAINKLLSDVDGPGGDGRSDGNTSGRVQGFFKNAFKDLFGSGDLGQIVAKAAMLYAGARLTGVSGNQALAFAAKAALQDGATEKAEKKAIEARTKAAIEARGATVDKALVRNVNWSKSPQVAIENYERTGDTAGLVFETATGEPIALGKKTAEELYLPGYGKVDVRSSQDGKGAFVRDPTTGLVIPAEAFRSKFAATGLTEWDKNIHDQATITGKFSTTADQVRKNANSKLNKFKGKDDSERSIDLVPDVLGNDAWNLYEGYVNQPNSKWRERTGELNGAINRAMVDYGEALANNASNPEQYDKPASLEAFVERQLFKVETGLGYNNVEATDAKNVKSTMKLVENQLAGDGVLTTDKRFAGGYKEDWADLQKLWKMVEKTDDVSIWHDREGWNGKMFFFNALLDANNPNHEEAMRTYNKSIKQ